MKPEQLEKIIKPFELIINVITGNRVDYKVFPAQLKAIGIHFDSIKGDIGYVEVNEKTDKLYYQLLHMLQHPHDEISKQIFIYISRATPYLDDRTQLVDYLSSHMELLLRENYNKYLSIVLNILTMLLNTSEQQVLDIVSKNYVLLFNLQLAIDDKMIGVPLKKFIVTICKQSDNVRDIFFDHLYQLSLQMNTNDDYYKFIEFSDEFLSEFKYNTEVVNSHVPNLHSTIFTYVHRIFFECNDELLKCALCNFFVSKISVDIDYTEKFLPNKPIIEEMVQLLDGSVFEKPFDRELLQLLGHMCSVKGLYFMSKFKIEKIFVYACNNEKISEKGIECLARCYFELLSDYDVFMVLTGVFDNGHTSGNGMNPIQSMNERMLKHIGTLFMSQCEGVSYVPVVRRMTRFFNNHVRIPGVELRRDYHDFVLRKHTFFDRFVCEPFRYIVKHTFETIDVRIQETGLEFVDSLLNYSWGFASMVDCSRLVNYLLENKMSLSVDARCLVVKILKKVAQNTTFLSVLDSSVQKKIIDLANSKHPPTKAPTIAAIYY